MKARVKATGVIVDVKCLDNNNWYDKLNDEYYLSYDLDFNSSDMPSEQRMRYELAKAAMQGFEANTSEMVNTSGAKKIVEWSIQIADEMIKQLKESEETK